jgi:hypothetical protein
VIVIDPTSLSLSLKLKPRDYDLIVNDGSPWDDGDVSVSLCIDEKIWYYTYSNTYARFATYATTG